LSEDQIPQATEISVEYVRKIKKELEKEIH
jgi:hypothetical protein